MPLGRRGRGTKERHGPAHALALGRSRQVVKEGWAARLRALKSLGKKRARAGD